MTGDSIEKVIQMSKDVPDAELLFSGMWRDEQVVCVKCGEPRAVSFRKDGLIWFRACCTCRVYGLKKAPAAAAAPEAKQ